MDNKKLASDALLYANDIPENLILLEALEYNDLAAIKELDSLDDSHLNSLLDGNQTMAIHLASKHGSFEIVAFLLKKFPDQLNQTDGFGRTPLFFAASKGHVRIVQYLIDKNAILSTEVVNPGNITHGLSPITNAMRCAQHQVVKILYCARALTAAEMNMTRSFRIILRWAVEQDYLSMVKYSMYQGIFDSLKIKEQISFMSVAVQKSSLAVIQQFVMRNPKLLSLVNENGKTPVFLASCRGEVNILQYFIDNKISVAVAGTPLYVLANERKHYAAANLIIHKLLNEENKKTIFDFITDGQTALEYMLLSPQNAKLIMQNQFLMNLVKNAGVHLTPTSVGYYKIAGFQRGSFFADINRETGEANIFKASGRLGEKDSKVARDFVDSHHQHVVIKSPEKNWIDNAYYDEELDRTHTEMEYAKTAFDRKSGHVFCFKRLNFFGKNEFTTRTVLPYAGRELVSAFAERINSTRTLANLMLSMAKSLISLHDKGIVHGDVQSSNVVISEVNNEYFTTFIDFQNSYYLTNSAATISPALNHWAPERRCSHNAPVPDISQDVYSFADMLNKIILEHKQRDRLTHLFPSIMTFIIQALDPLPGNRPTLGSFHSDLHNALALLGVKRAETTASEKESNTIQKMER